MPAICRYCNGDHGCIYESGTFLKREAKCYKRPSEEKLKEELYNKMFIFGKELDELRVKKDDININNNTNPNNNSIIGNFERSDYQMDDWIKRMFNEVNRIGPDRYFELINYLEHIDEFRTIMNANIVRAQTLMLDVVHTFWKHIWTLPITEESEKIKRKLIAYKKYVLNRWVSS